MIRDVAISVPSNMGPSSTSMDTTTTMSSTLDSTAGEGTLTPPTPGEGKEPAAPADAGKPTTTVRDDKEPAAEVDAGLSDELQALKMKILELEKKATVDPSSRPQLTPDMERYRRMEQCLYQHRKEWDVGNVERRGGRWGADIEKRVMTAGPAAFRWEFDYPQPSLRPKDHFESSHECADSHGDAAAIYDDYDRTIDYGDRRLRLRKHFEWEWDRLYLAEEFDRRKQFKKQEAETRPQEDLTMAGAEKTTGEGDGELEGEDAAAAPLPTFAKPKLNRVDWLMFKRLCNLDEEDADMIDILVGEPIVDDERPRYRGWYSRRPIRNLQRPQDRKSIPLAAPGQAQLPERIRIHSLVLGKILANILGSDYKCDTGENDEPTMVFIRPFKSLVHCERALRDWCTALEKKFQNGTVVTGDSSAGGLQNDGPASEDEKTDQASAIKAGNDGTIGTPLSNERLGVDIPAGAKKQKQKQQQAEESGDEHDEDDGAELEEEREGMDDPSDITKSATALEHLKCLLSFMDTDIVARQTYLSSPSCNKVFFSDLWLLFRPGVEVVGSDGKQAYRVIQVSSPVHRVVPSWQGYYNPPQGNEKGAKAPFSITCIYIDFDGKLVGPVRRIFPFKRFEGQRDVTSLEVYPLRLHPFTRSDFSESEWKEIETIPPDERYRQKFVHRGIKFLNVAAVKPMYYTGPTLEVRDEVESQVVVDFRTAFSVENKEQQAWKPTLEFLLGNPPEDEKDETDDGRCRGDCCTFDHVNVDNFVDQKQSNEYIESTLPKKGFLDEQPSVAVMPRLLEELQTAPGNNTWKVSDKELVIMSYRAFGFVLRSRKWGRCSPPGVLTA